MEKVQYCSALPGCCWMCRSSNRAWYVDTGQSIDYYGAVYICNSCIEEMARFADMVSPSGVEEFKARISFFENENFDLRVKVSGLEQAIDGLRIAGRIPGPDSFSPSSVDYTSKSEGLQRTEDSLATGEGTSPEQVHDEGVGELHSDESSSDRPEFTLDI